MEHGSCAVDILTDILTVAETGSTNADLLALAEVEAAEGQWLRADRQLAGRGRQGRVWDSPVGNLYASTIMRVREGDPPPSSLALVAGVALADVVADLVDDMMLKWPNDLLVGKAKLAGILLERAGDAVVIGFGVNVMHHPHLPGRTTTSLADHGAVISPELLVELLAARLAGWVKRWRADGLAAVRAGWLSFAHPIGTRLRVALPDQSVCNGRFGGLDHDGALLLALEDGSARVVHAGDVFAL